MSNGLRTFALSIAAGLIGFGNVACICASPANASPWSTTVASDHAPTRAAAHQHHEHHGATHRQDSSTTLDHEAPNSPIDHACGHCDASAVAASTAPDDGAIAPFTKLVTYAALAAHAPLPDFARGEVAPNVGRRWRAPPAATPVSLKIRLRN